MKDTELEMIDRYVRGEMQGDELRAFEQRMAANSELAAEVAHTERVVRSVQSVAEKKAQMAQWNSDSAVRPMPAKRGPWRVIVASAAGLALVIVCGWWLLMKVGSAPDDRVGSALPTNEFRGGTGLDSIEAMIEWREYGRALAAIDVAMADTVIDSSLPSEQVEYQRILLADKLYELRWMRIIALANTGQRGLAVEELKEYIELEGSHQEQAKELLNRLCE
ncbi:MAG: hypothetical protein ACI4AM_03565 [Muribaculaceae bacterium]